ncbi:DUF6443 domain-containing protein [Phocaeicola sp.]
MKRIYLFIISICSATMLLAQINSQNYISTRTMLNSAGSSCTDQFQYYDGLGRAFMLVKKGVTSDKKNLISLQEYDTFGRQEKSWLPIVTTTDYMSTLSFKSSAPGNYGNDSRPYGQLIYEISPMDRICEQYGPGVAWYSGYSASTTYLTNGTQSPLNCISYSVNSTGTLTNGGNYAAGQLYVTQAKDEDGNITYTFTDKQDRMVLLRQMEGSETNDTYYVYDELGNLCFVLQPMYQSNANLDFYAFQYRYDSRNRCVWKKMPGSQYIEYVYDNADRLIFSQNGNQRTLNKWTFYQYDNLNRLVKQGECTDKNTSSNSVVHILNFYDNYSFRSQSGFNNSNFPDGGNYGKGLLTGRVITAFGGNVNLYSANYYDAKGRVAKTVQSNLLGGYDVVTTTYTFTDKPSSVAHTHTASSKKSQTEAYTYSYDHADRLEKVEHTLNGTKVVLVSNTYDNFGRLSAKSLHGSSANRLSYGYNIRNWLTSIGSTCFTQNLYYNTGNGIARYNGNISSMTWKSGNETTARGYKFTYDGLDRLLNATYGEGTSISTNTNRFSENVTEYDRNGNIKTLQRYGQTSSTAYGLIDNLTCTLTGNQLNRVDDSVTGSAYNGGFEFKDAVKQSNEYTYDSNGNLTKDLNKGITGIQYNVLNLPSSITFSDGSSITYTYAADGTKLRAVHKIGSTTTTTDYCGNVVYENGAQKLLLTEEGYVSLGDNKYHYYLKDHQGNNRVVINQSGSVEETNHYYPFGGLFASTSNVQPYKYNGKEYDGRKGLNWYDYGARHYDAALGRWHVMDPMSELYNLTSPYTYCLNNPSLFVDPDGMQVNDSIVSGGTLSEVVIRPTKVLPPVSGLWGNVFNFLFGRTYSSPVYGVNENGISTVSPIGTITYNVNRLGYITGVAPIGGIAPLPSMAGKVNNIPELLKVAAKPSKSGLTAVGRALKKHGDRVGSIFPQARGNQAAINAQGEKVLKDILTDPNVQIMTTKSRSVGEVLDYKIPGGMGARFSADGKNFIGFLEPN